MFLKNNPSFNGVLTRFYFVVTPSKPYWNPIRGEYAKVWSLGGTIEAKTRGRTRLDRRVLRGPRVAPSGQGPGVTRPSIEGTWIPWGRPEIVDFWGLGDPGGPKNHSERWGAKPPIFWHGFGGRRGRPDPKNRRFPAGPKTMHSKPKGKVEYAKV
jgi:hypothetical protein